MLNHRKHFAGWRRSHCVTRSGPSNTWPQADDGTDSSTTKKPENSSKRNRHLQRTTQSDAYRDAGVTNRAMVDADRDAYSQKVKSLIRVKI